MRGHIGYPRITTGSDFLKATGKETEVELNMITIGTMTGTEILTAEIMTGTTTDTITTITTTIKALCGPMETR